MALNFNTSNQFSCILLLIMDRKWLPCFAVAIKSHGSLLHLLITTHLGLAILCIKRISPLCCFISSFQYLLSCLQECNPQFFFIYLIVLNYLIFTSILAFSCLWNADDRMLLDNKVQSHLHVVSTIFAWISLCDLHLFMADDLSTCIERCFTLSFLAMKLLSFVMWLLLCFV